MDMNDLQILSPFDRFDPIAGRPSHHLFDQAESVIIRARRLLRERSREQVVYLAETVNFLLAYRDPQSRLPDRLDDADIAEATRLDHDETAASPTPPLGRRPGLPGAGLKAHPDRWFSSPAQALYGLMEHFDIDNQTDLPGAGWSEYFAALALALVGESLQVPAWTLDGQKGGPIVRELMEVRYVAKCLIDAMETLGRAELLRECETQLPRIRATAVKEAQEKIRLQGQKGGIKRHAETNRIKRDFIQFVEDSFKPALRADQRFNKAAAAREYYAEFLEDQAPKDIEGAFRHRENWLRTLQAALREYK
jgi:hypothetical protein